MLDKFILVLLLFFNTIIDTFLIILINSYVEHEFTNFGYLITNIYKILSINLIIFIVIGVILNIFYLYKTKAKTKREIINSLIKLKIVYILGFIILSWVDKYI